MDIYIKIFLYCIYFLYWIKSNFCIFIINIITLIKMLEYFPILHMPPLMASSFSSPPVLLFFHLLHNRKTTEILSFCSSLCKNYFLGLHDQEALTGSLRTRSQSQIQYCSEDNIKLSEINFLVCGCPLSRQAVDRQTQKGKRLKGQQKAHDHRWKQPSRRQISVNQLNNFSEYKEQDWGVQEQIIIVLNGMLISQSLICGSKVPRAPRRSFLCRDLCQG